MVEPKGVPADDTDAHTVVDTAPERVESDLPDDSEPIPDSDPVETAIVPPPTPPVWSGGLIDLSSPWIDDAPLFVDPGDRAAGRAPQDALALPADLDGDGVDELIVGTLALGPGVTRRQSTWRWDGDGWVADPALSAAVDALGVGVPYGAVDLDGDGADELLFPGLGRPLAWGPIATGGEVVSASLAGQNDTGAAVVDLDMDGWLDLLLPERSCASSQIPWMRVGPRTFEAHPEWVAEGGQVINDAMLAWPISGRRHRVVTIGAGCSGSPHPGVVLTTPSADAVNLTLEAAFPIDAYWTLVPEFFGKPFTGVAPMGAGVADLNGDGWFDLIVTTGLDQIGVFATDAADVWTDLTWTAGVHTDTVDDAPPAPGGPPPKALAWSIGTPDLDQDGRPDLIVTTGDDATSYHVPDGRVVVNEVWWNAGSWPMIDVTEAVGFAMPGGWRGLMLHDHDGDGDADISLGGYGMPPRWYRNDLDAGHHGFSVRLRGTTSNLLGIGAVVEVTTADRTQRHLHVPPGNLQGTIEPTTWVGLGTATVGEVRVIWPTGYTWHAGELTAGAAHVLTEPALVTPLDDDRHVNAGATHRVRVTPRDPEGGSRAGLVEVSAAGATVTQDGDVWRLTRDTAGVVEVIVTIDGQEVLIHPRLWWD